jgi:hypothetical protein
MKTIVILLVAAIAPTVALAMRCTQQSYQQNGKTVYCQTCWDNHGNSQTTCY